MSVQSSKSVVVREEKTKKKEDTVAIYQPRPLNLHSSASYTSSLVVHLRQLHTDIHAQYKHDKTALTELNERFRQFVLRVQQLEAQNAKYLAHLGQLRGQASGVSSSVALEWDQQFLLRQTDITTVSYAKVGFELEVEMFQFQAAIYQQMIDTESQWKDDRRLKLEQELNQTSTVLNTIRASYADLGRQVESYSVARTDAYKQYMKLTTEWCRSKKIVKEWQLNMQSMKNHVLFYKNLRSHSIRGSETTYVGVSFDAKQFWALEFEKSVKKIRHDFQLLYTTIQNDMTAHYKARMEEAQIEIEQGARSQKIEIEELTVSQQTIQTIQVDYEKVQASFSYEEQIRIKLESSYTKLESDYDAIQYQNDERIEVQTKDIISLQETIIALAYEIEEMRRRKISLEGEIIVYRHLLGEVSEPTVVVTAAPVSTLMKRRLVVKNTKKGSIGIIECAPDGAFIGLVNHSTNEDVDLSKWVLIRRVSSSKTELRYTVPDKIRLPPRGELRIYSKQGGEAAKSSKKSRVVSSARQELVNNDAASWGGGDTVETILVSQSGEQKAFYSQSISLEEANI